MVIGCCQNSSSHFFVLIQDGYIFTVLNKDGWFNFFARDQKRLESRKRAQNDLIQDELSFWYDFLRSQWNHFDQDDFPSWIKTIVTNRLHPSSNNHLDLRWLLVVVKTSSSHFFILIQDGYIFTVLNEDGWFNFFARDRKRLESRKRAQNDLIQDELSFWIDFLRSQWNHFDQDGCPSWIKMIVSSNRLHSSHYNRLHSRRLLLSTKGRGFESRKVNILRLESRRCNSTWMKLDALDTFWHLVTILIQVIITILNEDGLCNHLEWRRLLVSAKGRGFESRLEQQNFAVLNQDGY